MLIDRHQFDCMTRHELVEEICIGRHQIEGLAKKEARLEKSLQDKREHIAKLKAEVKELRRKK